MKFFIKHGLGARHLQVFFIFLAAAISYALRVNLNIAIVEMVNGENPDFKKFTNWDEKIKSLLLSSFYWGYIINQVPGGEVSKRYGCKRPLLIGIFISSVINLIIPISTSIGDWPALIALRVLEGMAQGVIFPSFLTFLANWIPILERGYIGAFCYSGFMLGTGLMLISSGVISSSCLGWPGIFYISGSIGILWCLLWFHFGASDPNECKFISDKELNFIQNNLNENSENCDGKEEFINKNIDNRKIPTPWIKILTSVPFLALLICHVCEAFGFIVLLTEIPTYLNAVLGMDINNNAVLSSLPYFAMWLLGYLFAFLSVIVQKKTSLSNGASKKLFNSVGQCIPAAALLYFGFIEKDHITLAIGILIIAVGVNSAITSGSILNHVDLSPNHAGVLMGVTNGFTSLVDILTPIIVQTMVPNERNQLQWRTVFITAACTFFIGNLIFVIFGSGKIQSWNEPSEMTKRHKQKLGEKI